MSEAKDPLKGLTFEAAVVELDQIVNTLEGGETTLEEALALYERGQLLSKFCQSTLENAQLRVEYLTEDGEISPL